MDTRTKISRTCLSLSHPKVKLVTGHFDPLLPEHARRLQDLSAPDQLLIVVVTNPPNPLLSQTARAELVAALSVVDYVVIGEVVDDLQITSDFVAHVICKSSAS
jgi:glycerol-3-phosphate cytidylyltransferase-like family protein